MSFTLPSLKANTRSRHNGRGGGSSWVTESQTTPIRSGVATTDQGALTDRRHAPQQHPQLPSLGQQRDNNAGKPPLVVGQSQYPSGNAAVAATASRMPHTTVPRPPSGPPKTERRKKIEEQRQQFVATDAVSNEVRQQTQFRAAIDVEPEEVLTIPPLDVMLRAQFPLGVLPTYDAEVREELAAGRDRRIQAQDQESGTGKRNDEGGSAVALPAIRPPSGQRSEQQTATKARRSSATRRAEQRLESLVTEQSAAELNEAIKILALREKYRRKALIDQWAYGLRQFTTRAVESRVNLLEEIRQEVVLEEARYRNGINSEWAATFPRPPKPDLAVVQEFERVERDKIAKDYRAARRALVDQYTDRKETAAASCIQRITKAMTLRIRVAHLVFKHSRASELSARMEIEKTYVLELRSYSRQMKRGVIDVEEGVERESQEGYALRFLRELAMASQRRVAELTEDAARFSTVEAQQRDEYRALRIEFGAITRIEAEQDRQRRQQRVDIQWSTPLRVVWTKRLQRAAKRWIGGEVGRSALRVSVKCDVAKTRTTQPVRKAGGRTAAMKKEIAEEELRASMSSEAYAKILLKRLQSQCTSLERAERLARSALMVREADIFASKIKPLFRDDLRIRIDLLPLDDALCRRRLARIEEREREKLRLQCVSDAPPPNMPMTDDDFIDDAAMEVPLAEFKATEDDEKPSPAIVQHQQIISSDRQKEEEMLRSGNSSQRPKAHGYRGTLSTPIGTPGMGLSGRSNTSNDNETPPVKSPATLGEREQEVMKDMVQGSPRGNGAGPGDRSSASAAAAGYGTLVRRPGWWN